MFFNNSNGMSINPYQDFMWVAEYFDGSHLTEFNGNGIENSFYSINKNQLIRYGIVGCGHKMFFDTVTGIFNISGRTIQLEYVENDTIYNLTNSNVMYNDILQFKEAESSFNPSARGGDLVNTVSQFNFGYKQKLVFNDLHLNLKVICKIPYNKPIYLEISLTSDKALDGNLIIRRNNAIIDTIYAPVQKGMKGTLNWDII
jgi:hypothetical protein